MRKLNGDVTIGEELICMFSHVRVRALLSELFPLGKESGLGGGVSWGVSCFI